MGFVKLSCVLLIFPVFLSVFVNGDIMDTIRKLWASRTGGDHQGDEVSSGKSFSSRTGGYYDGGGGGGGGGGPPGGDPYMMSAASQRGWGWGGGGGGWGHDDHQNLDLYSLLGGLSFASLLGATIIYLARRNTSGRRRRSADGLSYLEDDEIDWSEDPEMKGLNIVELLDTFLDNRHIFFDDDSYHSNISSSNHNSSGIGIKGIPSVSRSSRRTNLGPGIVPHTLSDPVY